MLDAQQRVLRLNALAQTAGVQRGMPISTARAIYPRLRSLPREEGRERDTLESLAVWAIQFSPRISVSGSDALLIEIGGSLRLFGGIDALRITMQEAIQTLGYSANMGIAPCPRGAEVLALAQILEPAREQTQLERLLRPLPLDCLAWDARIQQRLDAVGVSCIGQCLALPRDGFRRRYGAAHLRDLDRLVGRTPDPRRLFTPPPTFHRSLDVSGDIVNTNHLIPGFEHLFGLLQTELRGRDCGVMRLRIALHHTRQSPTQFEIGLQRPGNDAQHWLSLLHEHLQRCVVAEPVRRISVQAQDFSEPGQPQQSLWQEQTQAQRQAILERLAARLGPSALYSLQSVATHHPESAFLRVKPDQGHADVQDRRARPIWLLANPQPIDVSRLQLCSRLERLESGWWAQDCQRDYYRARDPLNRYLWVFRDHRHPSQWFVHGFFA